MSVPGVSMTVLGMASMSVLDQNQAIFASFKPVAPKQMEKLRVHGKQFP